MSYVQGIKVERVIKRPDYDTTSINNDIALLRLESEVEFNSNVIPACLPTDRNQQYTNWEAVVSGDRLMATIISTFCLIRLGNNFRGRKHKQCPEGDHPDHTLQHRPHLRDRVPG